MDKQQIEKTLSKEFQELAEIIKLYIIKQAQGKRKFKEDGNGFIKQTVVDVSVEGVEITLPEHAKYIDAGRKAGGKKVPISELIKWLKRYRIAKKKGGTINDQAYAIQQAIYKKGILARPFIKKSEEFAEDEFIRLLDEKIVPELFKELDQVFEKV